MPKETFFNINKLKKNKIEQAALDEFSLRTYHEAKLSNIIKNANIPRGSFYQYFENKLDLYKYIFDIISREKMSFMSDLLPNPEKMSFLKLFEELYIRGIKFAKSDPRFVMITRNLILSGGDLINDIFGNNIELSKKFYQSYIETDKSLGRIRDDVDTELLVDFVVQTTTNIAFDEISKNMDIDMDKMYIRITKIIQILKKGIE